MSTLGFVGIGTAEHFNGRYNHCDSYPTDLGAEVWATVQRFLHADRHVHGFATLLLGYTDWRQVASGGRCEYCGKITGQPHSISGTLFVRETTATTPDAYAAQLQLLYSVSPGWALELAAEQWPLIENRRRTGYPDPEAQYHEHDADNPEDSAITPDTVDWLFMEWGYLIDPDRNRLHVLVGCIETPITYTVQIIRPSGAHKFWRDKARYTGALVGSYDLAGPEPNWEAVEEAGRALREQLEAEFAVNPNHPLLATVRALPRVEVWDQRETVSS
ncbi:hypothetical protein [Sulfobacillus harzensis]|uniref:Uncharacterized protein n=1 Tax=Sulfobacillus harzensis TaxID=2729629 RepID=A0A7Y0LAL6_9FIRM|nr:hypothetical protein [Sulfobacillus harzensis]NMP24909.1 hypothetical protein [Sulfobacillus harzensis]